MSLHYDLAPIGRAADVLHAMTSSKWRSWRSKHAEKSKNREVSAGKLRRR